MSFGHRDRSSVEGEAFLQGRISNQIEVFFWLF